MKKRLANPSRRIRLVTVAPSQRNLGGADLYLKVPGEAEPLHVLAEGQRPAAYPLKSQVRLQPEVGRWWGRWGSVAPLGAPPAAGAAAGVAPARESAPGG